MRHIIEIEKPKETEYKSKIEKANKYSYKTIIPKEVMKTFPQLKEDAQIVYRIKQISTTQFECDITFQADGISIKDDKETAPAIDEPRQKTTEKKPIQNNESKPAGNTLDVKHFADTPIQNGKYIIKVTSPKRPKLRIVGATIKDEIGKQEIGLSVAKKSEDEVRVIIDAIQSIEDADAVKLNELINGYKSEQYRT